MGREDERKEQSSGWQSRTTILVLGEEDDTTVTQNMMQVSGRTRHYHPVYKLGGWERSQTLEGGREGELLN